MEALFSTDICELVVEGENRITELENVIRRKQSAVYEAAKMAESFDELQGVMKSYNVREEEYRLAQHKDALEYLKACEGRKNREVRLTQTEWRHYFKGDARPEWC